MRGIGFLATVSAFVCCLASVSPAQPASSLHDDMLIAMGKGLPPATAVSPAQARLMAERAALLDALRKAAVLSGRAAPRHYNGAVSVGARIREFRIVGLTHHPDGSVEVEVSVPRAGVSDAR